MLHPLDTCWSTSAPSTRASESLPSNASVVRSLAIQMVGTAAVTATTCRGGVPNLAQRWGCDYPYGVLLCTFVLACRRPLSCGFGTRGRRHADGTPELSVPHVKIYPGERHTPVHMAGGREPGCVYVG